ncbi:hypothetical protein EIN_020130 [Entamoeba invadens IP1]|uniref:hypothetical protein n=1 Tax=Entamoeba invadens IP1 TaxID=370355 RepID=UPI0002C3EAF5|nr:hypothetical protein EIN_020130 [Entamoeba invadens IP1]ELP90564.1 hypothetical protein EIN_020130 [Entamoeba invadens IP1]|eukprot:XP_004257335.1 hypothetical protein EIN_020130 [Entamoeba invadens IP1]
MKSVKEVDSSLKKMIKGAQKEKITNLAERIFKIISETPAHPLLDVIESTVHSLNSNISRIVVTNKDKNEKVASEIKRFVKETSRELVSHISSYLRLKSVEQLPITQFEDLLFDLSFDSIKKLFCSKEENKDKDMEYQFKKLVATDLKKEFRVIPPKFPADIEAIFVKSLVALKGLDKTTTLIKTRAIIDKIQELISQDLSCAIDQKKLSELCTDDYINILAFLLTESHLTNIFGILAMIEGFKNDSDDTSRFGLSFINLCVGAKTLSTM